MFEYTANTWTETFAEDKIKKLMEMGFTDD
jgi:hypothetical protein